MAFRGVFRQPAQPTQLRRVEALNAAQPGPQVSAVAKLDDGALTTNLTAYTTNSVAPTAGRTLVVFVQMAGIAAAVNTVVSGLSGTWTRVGGIKYGTDVDLSVHVCTDWTGSGTLTLTNSDGATNCLWSVLEVAGGNTATPVVAASLKAAAAGNVNTVTATLDAVAASGNRHIAAFGNATNNTINQATPRAGWTELTDQAIATPGGVLEVQTRLDATETTASVDWVGGPYDSAYLVVEMAAADAPVAYTRTVDDPTGVTDAGSIRTLTAAGTDSAGLTDSATRLLFVLHSRTADDSAGLVDTRAVARTATADDSAGLTDARAVAQSAAVTDSAGLADAATVLLERVLTDSAGLTDAATPVSAGAATRTVDDGAGLADTRAVDLDKVVTDSAGFADAGASSTLTATGTDTLGLTDTASLVLTGGGPITRTVDDSVGLADGPVSGAYDSAVTDSAGLADSTAKQVAASVPLRQQVAVPAYFNPTTDPGTWDALMANHTNVPFIVVSPASGPGGSADPDYTTRINAARAAGIRVYGYVDTNYGAVLAATADADIDQWRSLYTVDGIFFDRTPGDTATVAYMTARANKVRATGTAAQRTVVVNPGWYPTDEAHVTLADHAMVFENDYATLVSTPEAWYPAYLTSGAHPPDKFWWAFYGATFTQMLDVLRRARGWRIGTVYVTDDTITPLPYDSLPSYWTQLLALAYDPADLLGPTDVTASAVDKAVTDSAGLIDAVTQQLAGAGVRTVNDSAGLADSRAIAQTATITDSAGIADAGTLRTLVATGTDSAGIADSISATLVSTTATRTVHDSTGITDSGGERDVGDVLTDSAGLADSVTTQTGGATSRTVDDSVGLADSRTIEQASTVTDAAGFADTRALAQTVTVTDSAGLTDSRVQNVAGAGARTVDDPIGLAESFALVITITVADTAGLTDQATPALAVPRAFTDSAGLADNVSALFGKAATVDDLIGLVDTRAVATVFSRAQDDGAGLADTLAFAYAATVTDSAGLIDLAGQGGVNLRTLTDSAGFADVVAGTTASSLNQLRTDLLGPTDAVLANFGRVPVVTGRPTVTGDTARPTVIGDRTPAGVT